MKELCKLWKYFNLKMYLFVFTGFIQKETEKLIVLVSLFKKTTWGIVMTKKGK